MHKRKTNDMVVRIPEQRPLKVVLAATKAAQYDIGKTKGLSQIAGMVPSALKRIGVESSLILPFFRQTREAIKKYGLEDNLEDLFAFQVKIGSRQFDTMVKKLDSPLSPSYPVYFVEQKDLFDREAMYDHPDDLSRFSFFSKSAFRIIHSLGLAPDIIDCQDWQCALIPVNLHYMAALRSINPESDFLNYFANTKSVFRIHSFRYQGEFTEPHYHEAGLNWEDSLPKWAEFYGRANMIKAGLMTAAMSYDRSTTHLTRVAGGESIQRDFEAIVRGRIDKKELVALWTDDKSWNPDMEFSESIALLYARHLLGLYRHITVRDFGAQIMEQALQTTPALSWEILTTKEKISRISTSMELLYSKASDKDKKRIEDEVAAGRSDRFAPVQKEADLEAILDFLKIDPAFDFEKTIRYAGPFDLLDIFNGNDINRILAWELDIKKCKDEKLLSVFAKRKEVTLFEAMEALGITSHVLRLLQSIKSFAQYKNNPASERRLLWDFYDLLQQNPSLFKAFILGAILHDIGKCIALAGHPKKGSKLLENIHYLKFILSEEEFDFAKNIILHHSSLDDVGVIKEALPQDIEQAYLVYADNHLKRRYLADALFLLSAADMNASGETSRLSLKKLRLLRDAYDTLSSDTLSEVRDKLAALGLSSKKVGNERWDHWIAGETDKNIKLRGKALHLAAQELARYCRKNKLKAKTLKRRLGAARIYGTEDVINKINDPVKRARFLIRIAEYTHFTQIKELSFDFSSSEKMQKLLDLLKKEEFTMIDIIRDFAIESDEEDELIIISI